jgi:probable HAF family extracellular repeat protein
MVGLGSIGGSNFNSSATGISADGSIIVGTSVNANGSVEAFRWTPELGQVNFEGTYISDVSANGSVMVGGSILGEYYFNASRASRWTQETGFVALGNLGDNSRYSTANAASTDGSVVVGFSGNANGYLEAFRWTQQTGMVGLGSLIGNSDSYANGVSADGSIIVGESNGQAFRWTQETGMVDLGSVIGSANYATDVSADGSIIVGSSNGQGFRWTQSTGKVSLKETLIGAGLDVSGWTLYSANAISADGFTIVGYGANPSGQQEAWVAKLSPEPIPEPLTILGSIAAIAFAAGFERKFGKNKSDEKDPEA